MPKISCAFPPVPDTPEHIALAEQLGYTNAWCYDTPALQTDVWMTLARAADRTNRIGLGPAVLIPSLRHVLTTPPPSPHSSIWRPAAPPSVSVPASPVAWRSGNGRCRLPRCATTWSSSGRSWPGESVEIDGAAVEMLHGPGQAPTRPIEVPFLFAIGGPKSDALAAEVFDGILTVVPTPGFDWSILMALGHGPGRGRDLRLATGDRRGRSRGDGAVPCRVRTRPAGRARPGPGREGVARGDREGPRSRTSSPHPRPAT